MVSYLNGKKNASEDGKVFALPQSEPVRISGGGEGKYSQICSRKGTLVVRRNEHFNAAGHVHRL
jgi:hypothetical protein